MKKIKFVIAVMLAGLLFLAGCATNDLNTVNGENSAKITVYKSASCGCCGGYVAQLQSQGFTVETIITENIGMIKQKYNIPQNMSSCHTAVAGDYFIEGHVPIEAVSKLLREKPEIDGIALPRMPAGSPGMPGIKKEPFTIYGLTNGKAEVFTVV